MIFSRPFLAVLAIVFTSMGFIGFGDRFAPDAELWAEWQAHDADANVTLNYDNWDVLLSRYLATDGDGVARFAYGDVTAQDRAALDALLEEWSAVAISEYSREQQLAYWINLYNALTVQLILESYPVDSIQDIKSGFLGKGPWDGERIEVEGVALTLNDIEHRILRPIWQDARLHYALNCASVGCPNLRERAWRAESIDADLDAAARAYINDPRGFRIDAEGNAIVSKIYAWFVEDFGGDEAGVVAHLKAYAEGATLERLEGLESLADTDYDWSLNASAAR